MTTTPGPIVTNDSRITVENRFITVREDAVTFPGGIGGIYNVVTSGTGQGVAILPLHLDRDGHWCVGVVGQYRYPLGHTMLEIPRGGSNGLAESEAARELEEETGISGHPLIFLGNIAPDSGLLNTVVPTYAVITDGPAEMVPENGCTTQWMRWNDYTAKVRSGEILADAFTLSAMALWMSSSEAQQLTAERMLAAQAS
jgi:8-oxo-dGTP pyrophosphatase MutT (NUDIX family)